MDWMMGDRLLGKLPPLQRVGRSQSIDFESPPESSSEGEDLPSRELSHASSQPFLPEDANRSAKVLGRSFRVLNPGNHVCKRSPNKGTNFVHCRHSMPLGKKYGELRKLMETRSQLQLVKDYTSRINAARSFVENLEQITREEHCSWDALTHKVIAEPSLSKLECLHDICEEVRIHAMHWTSIKQRMHTDKWLRPLLPQLSLEIDSVRVTLTQLRDSALWWVDKLIRVGLHVFAHVDSEKISYNLLWSVTRGIEEYGAILAQIKQDSVYQKFGSVPFDSLKCQCVADSAALCHPVYSNSSGLLSESIKPIPFARVLSILANERSKRAAKMTHSFLTECEEFIELVQLNKLPSYTWETSSDSSPKGRSDSQDTSDYHSETVSHSSLSTSMLKVGNVLAPDLSKSTSPLVGFTQQEQEFSSQFLQIVCSSTSLLRRSNMTPKVPKALVAGATGAPRKIKLQADEPQFSRSDPKRKSVSWGDAADTSVKLQLSSRYMDLLWASFGNNLLDLFYHHLWEPTDALAGKLGNLALCPDIVAMLLVHMIQQLCVKDLFPGEAVEPLLRVARSLEAECAWSAWDTALCAAYAWSEKDKCHPTPLADNDFSTTTAKLLRDTFSPLFSVLSSHQEAAERQAAHPGSNGIIGGPSSSGSLLLPSLQRLVLTCDLANRWSHGKAHQFLAAWNVGAFLLVTQSDLKILTDETKRALHLAESLDVGGATGNPVELQSQKKMAACCLQLEELGSQGQTLSGSAMKLFTHNCSCLAMDYFQSAMPLGKIWRKKSDQEWPTEPNQYAEQVLDAILEPIVEGVSKLKTAAQLSAISMAVQAMCGAWTQLILKEKIRFSLYGAHQLQLDFAFVRTWLEGFIANEEVKQSILALDIFKYLLAAVELLKRQPKKRHQLAAGKNNTNKVANDGTDYSVATDLPGSIASGSTPYSGSSDTGSEDCDDLQANDLDMHNYQNPHMEQWLALRVHGGSRSWKLPNCFTPAPAQD